MVVYDLECENGHRFEGWFDSEEKFKAQNREAMIACPVCDAIHIKRIPSATYISKGKAKTTEVSNLQINDQLMQKLRKYINSNFDDVGGDFADQALKMHYGEVAERNIRGQATQDEMQILQEEGVDVFAMPEVIDKKKLN